ncbi:MAG TPA: bifunctional adenosylcobinamide kinase/adenosylcobinamide-phosphate guanylyltransferase [Acidimicrobiales bacterium]|nr:bifunctional adenosylcobinamide kinase/adenosylcobinamide-phosphate guanylyltransferase [Acidimicrobiales bacterium]
MIILVLGGARSGKSVVAERQASEFAGDGVKVTYVATAVAGGDVDLDSRIAEHRARRPEWWATVEASADLAGALRQVEGVALVDGLGPWLGALAGRAADTDALCAALTERSGDTVVVSDEVGMGVHPSTEAGRRFRDALGLVNQAVAARADRVLLVVAGRVLPLEPAV